MPTQGPDIQSPKVGFFARISNTFLAGIFAALPLALTIGIIVWVADFLQRYLGPDSYLGRMLGAIGLNFVSSDITAYTIGVGSVLLLVYLLGLAVETGLRNRWRGFVSALLNRVPFVRSVYNTLSRIITMFDKQEEAQYKSMAAVLCYFDGNKQGTAVLALLTSPTEINLNGQPHYAVMIPTAPVPFGGAILYVPVANVERVDFGFDGLFNIYMSMGVTSADFFPAPGAAEKPAT